MTFIDLFCGCGGFSLGMQRAGFKCLAAIDFNPEAVDTFKANFSEKIFAICTDITQFPPQKLASELKVSSVDVVVGGPPCQGFSLARKRDGANHGARLKADPRRHLYKEFLRYVEYFQPKIFVMENVLGIRSAAGGEYFTAVQKEARQLGYRVHGQIEDAWELGVPQKRRRQLFIGVRSDINGYFVPKLNLAPRAESRVYLGAAIGDLPPLKSGSGENECEYDFGRRNDHVKKYGNIALKYLREVLEIDEAKKLTNHIARPHSERDLRDFALLKEGENSAVAMRDRGIKFEFPYDKSTFKDRYTRQSRWHACSTIVAHLSKDGLMFIHPTQNRSITPREAARIQSFPDWFVFPEARTHSFRLIGNAVPPLVAEAVGLAVKKFLTTPIKNEHQTKNRTRHAAALELQKLANLDRCSLRQLPTNEFLSGWRALLFLFPDLHPDNALDHGEHVDEHGSSHLSAHDFEGLASRRYARSGWPVALELIGIEAWRRYEDGQITMDQLYSATCKEAGLMK